MNKIKKWWLPIGLLLATLGHCCFEVGGKPLRRKILTTAAKKVYKPS